MDHGQQGAETIGAMLSGIATTLRELSARLDAVAAHVGHDRSVEQRLAKLEAWAFRTEQDVSEIGSRVDRVESGSGPASRHSGENRGSHAEGTVGPGARQGDVPGRRGGDATSRYSTEGTDRVSGRLSGASTASRSGAAPGRHGEQTPDRDADRLPGPRIGDLPGAHSDDQVPGVHAEPVPGAHSAETPSLRDGAGLGLRANERGLTLGGLRDDQNYSAVEPTSAMPQVNPEQRTTAQDPSGSLTAADRASTPHLTGITTPEPANTSPFTSVPTSRERFTVPEPSPHITQVPGTGPHERLTTPDASITTTVPGDDGIMLTGSDYTDEDRAHVDKLQAMLDELKKTAAAAGSFSRSDVFGPPTTEPTQNGAHDPEPPHRLGDYRLSGPTPT